MKEISRESGDNAKPYENLLPVVDFLAANGNRPVDGGFLLNPDGWRCRMSEPLDFCLVRENFKLPDTLLFSHDSILDRSTWCVIEGPGVH